MSNTDPCMRIGLVGCGGIAHTHAAAVALSDHMTLAACTDLVRGKADDFAAKHGVPRVYDSMQDLVRNERLDLVLLATWPAQHLEQIRECCALGAKAILCEKALAMNAEEADEIQRIATAADCFLMEGLMYRHHPQIQKALELVRDGAIGQLCYVHGQFGSPAAPDPSNWRHRREDGGGSMAAKGCYLVDALCTFAGRGARSAYCYETTHPATNVEVGMTGTIVFDDDVVGQFESTHRAAWREELRVCGDKGAIVIPHFVMTKTQPRHIELQTEGAYEQRPMRVERFEFLPANSYHLQLENVRACLFAGGAATVPLDESVRNYHVTSALLKSAASGKAEPVC